MRRVTIDFVKGGSFSMSDNAELDAMGTGEAKRAVTQQARLNGFKEVIRKITVKD